MKNNKSVLKKLKDKAQKVFNTWVRYRDSYETTDSPWYAICCTCGKESDNSGDLQAGHFIKDSLNGNSTSFDEMNVNSQCKKCNRYLHGNDGKYALFLIKKYGQDKVDELMNKKLITKKWTIDELEEIHLKYKLKLKNEFGI